MRRYILIGSGAAGIAAAEAIRSQDPGGEILMVSEDPLGYYSRPGLAFLLTGELPEKLLYPFREEDFKKRLNITWLHARVKQIDPQHHQVLLENRAPLVFDRLLIATGASAVHMDVPGSDLAGVVKLDSLTDARQILKMASHTRSAVVIGGGITALELVEGLTAHKVKVHYFLRGDRYWNNVLDETEARIVEQEMIEHGVKIHYRTETVEVLGSRGRVAGVRTKDGEVVPCEMVAVAIGVRARTELAKASGLVVEKGVMVNEYLNVRIAPDQVVPDIFAAGDVAQAFDPLTGKSVLDTLWKPARDQGSIAGLNMVGVRSPYRKIPPFNVTRLAGLTTTIIGMVGSGRDDDLVGIARGDSETWRQLPDALAAQTDFDVNRLRILVGQDTLLGAIVMGDQTLSHSLQRLISDRVDITPIRESLLAPGAPLGDIIVDYWTQWIEKARERTKPLMRVQ